MSSTTFLLIILTGLLGGIVGYAVGARRAAATPAAIAHAVRSAAASASTAQTNQLVEVASGRFELLEQASAQRWSASGDAVTRHLEQLSTHLSRLESERLRDTERLATSVQELRRSTEQIRDEARGLSSALNDGAARGSWGEMQLRRVLEHAGMVANADFVEQLSVKGDQRTARPDMVIRLPNRRCVVIDSKSPLDAFLRASAADDPAQRRRELAQHARAMAGHVDQLAARGYDDMVEGSVDFVVMFVPGEAFLSAALEQAPDLLERAASRNVILASPTTLLAFLRGVAAGWREERVADEAAAIAALGRELHERVAVFSEHFDALGSALGRAVGSYNTAAGSMQHRLLVTARRLEELDAGSRRTTTDPRLVDEAPNPVLVDVVAASRSSVRGDSAAAAS